MNRSHSECRGEQGGAREPEQAPPALGGRVHPGREDRRERERAVGVVEIVGGTAVVGEEQQAEADLGDEERLGEREQMREPAARHAPPPVDEPAGERRERGHADDEEGEEGVGR